MQASEHKLPMRKRRRLSDPANVVVPDIESETKPVELPGSLITLDLIQELVQNGSLACHFDKLQLFAHRSGWKGRSQLSTEVEFGSVMATVHAVPVSRAGTEDGNVKSVPLLLRAFRKQSNDNPVNRRTQTTVQHALWTTTQPLDQWAPVTAMHVVRALGAAGVHFQGPQLHYSSIRSQVLSSKGRSYILARRQQTQLDATLGANLSKVNWKLKYTVPINYPGNQQDHLQLAWEVDEDVNEPVLRQGAIALGLHVLDTQTMGEEGQNVYIKLQWTATCEEWDIVIYLAFVLPKAPSLQTFSENTSMTPRPRGATEVPVWLGRLGASIADWRIEVELRPPHTQESIAKGLFLHYLVRQVTHRVVCKRYGGHICTLSKYIRFHPVWTTLVLASQGTCLSRPQFVMLFQKYLTPPIPATVSFRGAEVLACTMLTSFCIDNGIPVHRVTGYPIQPRPHDLVPSQVKKLCEDCFATPKVDGLEAFMVVHRYGMVIVLRDGTTRVRTCNVDPRMVPIILEGELLNGEVFVAYDCLLTPVINYAWRGRYLTRYTAMSSLVRHLHNLGCPCSFKPIFCMDQCPQTAIRKCMQWASARYVPCDGVVFISNALNGYGTGNRLWKVKYTPTIDFSVYHAYGDVYELMLRANGTIMQSLHRFSDGSVEYRLPVLMRAPTGVTLHNGDVVEVGVRVECRASVLASVEFTTMQVRERGKQANCLLGGMDLAARGTRLLFWMKKISLFLTSVDNLLQTDCPYLPRALLSGPIRRARNTFLQTVLKRANPTHIMEIGGGCGGDAPQLLQHSLLEIVDVVEPDEKSIAEYQRRLTESFGGTLYRQTVVLPDGRRFRFHGSALFDVSPTVAHKQCDMALLYFSISQIVASDTDADALLGGLLLSRRVRHIVVAVHDHLADIDLPHGDGVNCTMELSSGCSEHPLVCTCPHGNGKAAKLRTHIIGSTTAADIVENAFSVHRFLHRVQLFQIRHPACGQIAVQQWQPWATDGTHWLLRSLVFLWLQCDPAV